MTSERGGPTTQSGILYQNSIAALYLGRLCDVRKRPSSESVQQVKVEASEPVDDIVITYDDGHTEYIQAKENLQINSTAWKKVWKDFESQYKKDSFKKGHDQIILYLGTRHKKYDDLKSFCLRTEGNDTFYVWTESLSQEQAKFLDYISPIISPELNNGETFREFISHVRVKIQTKKYIQRDLVPVWMPESNKHPIEFFRQLRDVVAEKSTHRGVFNALRLREILLSEIPGLVFKTSEDIASMRNAIQDCSSQLRQQKCTISNTNCHVESDTVHKIVTWVKGEFEFDNNVSILLDQAGMGKSVVLHDVLSELEKQQIVTLAIKADRQLSNIDALRDIQISLGLPQPVQEIVGQLARLGQVVVIIDQIDALSLSLAHDQKALDIALDLVARLRHIPNVKIILSCRIFDYNSDIRLKNIEVKTKFTLKEFSENDVRAVLSTLNIEYDSLPGATQNLLATPLHLDLFAMALGENNSIDFQSYSVSSIQELYDLLWENVILRREHKAPSISERRKALQILTDYMDRERKTSVPTSLFHAEEYESLENATLWLASNGIIIKSNTEWTFLHQTFFDYSYARQFAENKGDIVSTILSSAQGILERPKLLYILSYMRGKQTREYLQALQELLKTSALRFHLYEHMLRWLGSLPNPSNEEWLIIQQMLLDENKRSQVLHAMYGNPAWFTLLHKNLLQGWLSQNTEFLDAQIIPYLRSMVDIEQEKISLLLKPYLHKSNDWLERIDRVLSVTRNWSSIEAILLYEEMIYSFSSLRQAPMYEIGIVAQAHPETGIRLLRYILDNATDEYKKQRQKNIDDNGGVYKYQFSSRTIMDEFHNISQASLDDAIRTISQQKPNLFVDQILPWLEDAILTQSSNDKESELNYIFDGFSYGWYENSMRGEYALIYSLIHALREIAKSNTAKFREIANRLSLSPYSSHHQILVRVFGAIPETYAKDACAYLLQDQRRLNLGDNGEYDSRQLITAIYPFLTEQEQLEIEDFIISYSPIHKNPVIGDLRWRGVEQYRLLSSIPKELLSSRGTRYLQQLERKFPKYEIPSTPSSAGFGTVISPISEKSAEKMSNENWLSAMQKYRGERNVWNYPKGGARELSAVLQSEIKKHPKRFYTFLPQIPDDIEDSYIFAFLNGFAESDDAPAEWLFNSVRRFSKDKNREIKRSIAWALEKRIPDGIPDDLIELLHSYIDTNIGDDELWWTKGENHGDAYSSYLNSDRGTAFHVLMAYYTNKDDEISLDAKWKLVEFVANDSSTALHIGAIHHLTYMIRHDRTRAIDLFTSLMQGQDVLLNSPYVREFIYWALYKNFSRLRPYIEAMLESDLDETQKQGAELACIASLSANSLDSDMSEEEFAVALNLVERTLQGTKTQQQGAARIYSHNLTTSDNKLCEEKIIVLLDNDDDQIQRSIGAAFSSMKIEHFYSLRSFIQVYVEKTRILHVFFSEFMLEHGLSDSNWTLSIITKLFKNKHWLENRTRSAGIENLIRLILKIYNSPLSTVDNQTVAMDLFDMLMEKFSWQTYKVLDEWDSR